MQEPIDELAQIAPRLKGGREELVCDLLVGTFASNEQAAAKARELGHDLSKPQLAFDIEPHRFDPATASRDQVLIRSGADKLALDLGADRRPLVGTMGKHTVVIVAMGAADKAPRKQTAGAVIADLGKGFSIGVGEPHPGALGARRSYREAREALDIGSLVGRAGPVFEFRDFLLYRFLRSDKSLAQTFVQVVIGGILDYDQRRRGELVPTLETYFAVNESTKDAARRLFTHPHTVTYRLKQIEKLTGRNFKNPEDKLHLHLAVRALRMYGDSLPGRPSPATP